MKIPKQSFNDAQKQEIKKQAENLIKLGYNIDHLLVTEDGDVIVDLDQIDSDVFLRQLKEKRKKS
ncbi:hypothetical protein [Geminocystis sp. GBBB08]|uniref:hypothetical protein n=1 Tax=Geminocystis sp. GBBB08 TaxID=2604140 RepID=UPI0027E264DF|nr:hypothetical protein [Geminocystis sp. GBBB08]MBL1211604.1 hypothetical protein [Geminocystis sp. GBBB08]